MQSLPCAGHSERHTHEPAKREKAFLLGLIWHAICTGKSAETGVALVHFLITTISTLENHAHV